MTARRSVPPNDEQSAVLERGEDGAAAGRERRGRELLPSRPRCSGRGAPAGDLLVRHSATAQENSQQKPGNEATAHIYRVGQNPRGSTAGQKFAATRRMALPQSAMRRAASHRLQWADVPEPVRQWIEQALGAPVVRAENQPGGYGPGMAARCELADGRRVFVKAASPVQNPDTPNMMREEARINAGLPNDAPAPRLLNALDDGEWVVLVFEDIDGREPGSPWTDDDLRAVGDLSRHVSGLVGDTLLPTVGERYARVFTGWRTLERENNIALDPWCRKHLSQLAAVEGGWEEVVGGDAVVHGDFRSDNILLGSDRAVLVDWTATCRGVPWFDLVTILPSIEVAGGPPPEEVAKLVGLEVDADALVTVVAAFAGYFAQRSLLPDPIGLPTVREFQRAQVRVTISWLRRLTGWD